MTTRGEMLVKWRRRLRLHPGTLWGRDPDGQEELCQEAVQEVAKETKCFWGYRLTGLTAATQRYCIPDIFEVTAALVKNSLGQFVPVKKIDSPELADRLLGESWRNTDNRADPPCHAVFENLQAVRLVSTPSTTRAAALKLEGFIAPYEFWEYDSSGVGIAIDDSTELPIPVYSQQTVFLYMMWKGAQSDERKEIRMLTGEYEGEYQESLAQLMEIANDHHKNVRP